MLAAILNQILTAVDLLKIYAALSLGRLKEGG